MSSVFSSIGLILCGCAGVLQAQTPIFDAGVRSTYKALFAQPHPKEPSAWAIVQHPCPAAEVIPKTFRKLNLPFAQASQGHLDALARGGVMLSNQLLGYTEVPALANSFAEVKGGKELLRCIEGIQYPDAAFMVRDVAYFDSLLYQLDYFKTLEKKSNELTVGKTFQHTMPKDQADLDLFVKSKDKMGYLLSIAGGHNLGSARFITGGQTQGAEYEKQVLDHLRILKGEYGLPGKPEGEYMPYLLFSIRLASRFDNGIVGNAHPKGLAEDKLMGYTIATANKGFTPLGKKVVEMMLSLKEGNRMLVDLAQMSLEGRQWYYDIVDSLRVLGDNIPIFVSYTGISGANWDDKNYLTNQLATDQKAFFQHTTDRMTRQDLHEIVESAGFLGIGLDYNTLLRGTRFEAELALVEHGSAAERTIVIQALAAQILKVIHTLQQQEAWEIIGISSQFDMALSPLPCYQSANYMADLQRDLLAFFKNPTDIYDLYTAKQIAAMCYGYTPEQVVNKVLYDNGIRFLRRALPKKFRTKQKKYRE